MVGGARSSRVAFADTSAYFAMLVEKDERHATARAIVSVMTQGRWGTLTTNLILPEIHALLLARRGPAFALEQLQIIERSSVIVVRVTPEDERRARDILGQYNDKDFSLTDATSFAVIERLGIPWAFTFDRNFTQYGVKVLSPDNHG